MEELVIYGKHLPVVALRDEPDVYGKYILKEDIPAYPRPELHVSHLSHSTDLRGFWGIRRDRGFKDLRCQDTIWFSLTVSPDELRDAEDRDMTIVHPGGREQEFKMDRKLRTAAENRPQENVPEEEPIPQQEFKINRKRPQSGAEEEFTPKKHRAQSEAEDSSLEDSPLKDRPLEEVKAEDRGALPERDFLQKFASSPAFKSSSRYGSFRFTFSLRVLLQKYSQQFCGGQEPVLRVYCTVMYKQEVMYAVLVHSPTNQELFSHLPLLEETPRCICAFRAEPEPHFIWRPQAMSETHRFQLVVNRQNKVQTHRGWNEFYVWDHVTLALHVDNMVLRFAEPELRQSLSFCEEDYPSVPVFRRFQKFEEAEDEVKKLWWNYHLQKFRDSVFHITE